MLQDSSLNQIQQFLLPSVSNQPVNDLTIASPATASLASTPKTVNIINPTSSNIQQSEFIPHIFYSLYQITKDPNNSANQLETTTSSIKNKLKNCKKFIENDVNSINLLSKSIDEWEIYLKQRDQEIAVRQKLLSNLNLQITDILDENMDSQNNNEEKSSHRTITMDNPLIPENKELAVNNVEFDLAFAPKTNITADIAESEVKKTNGTASGINGINEASIYNDSIINTSNNDGENGQNNNINVNSIPNADDNNGVIDPTKMNDTNASPNTFSNEDISMTDI
ncbi:hypothetical protein TBLA_0G01680 [Henningerozyma blattae CBS 6284]|uniref:Mediator of RNA polymerase II transcription subunit 9 n=1 Tax=Henningerozyma blattae (strain ATCC 34711 / CBS 6284 / DSM 70876 / NBRC 10599 / NRRL Y-10934 / UCD 77-7) TaxID=1071380 RepID=I2H6W0_HENB6|nr:hypothetical protein TBLA_0G01680 [Tetrapisispora blattae CBS 6284]CCH62112.1 hypothetical protein TBLA_0G01680 [Tetrapisispora blattae CBS 6284]